MKFDIKKGGVIIHAGKRLVTVPEGEYDTTDKDVVKALEGAKGVKKKGSAPKTEKSAGADKKDEAGAAE